MTDLNKRDLVEKRGGYPFPGVLLDTFDKGDGTLMANVESLFHPGMVHIFPVKTLFKFEGDREALVEKHIDFIRSYHFG